MDYRLKPDLFVENVDLSKKSEVPYTVVPVLSRLHKSSFSRGDTFSSRMARAKLATFQPETSVFTHRLHRIACTMAMVIIHLPLVESNPKQWTVLT